MKQKKQRSELRQLAEGVSRKIKRDLEDIIESLDTDLRHKGESMKQEYKKLCMEVEAITAATNQCYSLWVNDSLPLMFSNNRNPLILLKYSRLFMESLATLRQEQLRERQEKQKQNELAVNSYNSNNVYELVAKKNIEFVQMQAQINDLKIEKDLSKKKAAVAQEMTESIRSQSEELLRAYRSNFSKITELLRRAEQKQTQILQSNRLLTQKLQNLNHEYDNYKMNFKTRPPTGQGQKRLRQRIEKQYEQRYKLSIRQFQTQIKNTYKVK